MYKLDKQDISRDLAAKPVIVTGKLDTDTNTIHVTKIEVVENASSSDK